MNIKHYLSAMAALAMLAACSDYDPGMSENAVDLTDAEIETIQEYTANFVERYGEMDPNHTWGFGELAEMEEMGTRQSYPNSNQWVWVVREDVQKTDADGNKLWKANGGVETTEEYDESGNQRAPVILNNYPVRIDIPDGVKVPGFPVENYYLSSDYKSSETAQYEGTHFAGNYQGKYHFIFANRKDLGEQWFDSEKAILDYMWENNITGEIIALGDVVEFNTLTDAEVADVYAEFSKEWHGTNPDINLEAYFVQQIWHGTAEYPYWNQDKRTAASNQGVDYKELDPSGRIIGGEQMDYLVAEGEDDSVEDYQHFYNFNNSNSQLGQKGMMLIMNSNTTNFAYHDSQADETWWDHYRLVNLHGNWYVGFDFESKMKGETDFDKDIPRDHIYNDWIVKIIPGTGTIQPKERTNTIQRRIMCEDLGSTFDFDFNDLVFDVKYTREEKFENNAWVAKNSDGKWDATITLQAVGGTLPIYITNFDEKEYDAHELMGGTKSSNGTYSPVNVGTSATHDPVTLDMVRVTSTNPDNIVIRVTSPDKEERGADKVTTMILPSPSGRQSFGENLAPQKICMPVDVRWTKEYQQIEWAYPHFAEWVQNQKGAAGFGNESDWTRTDVDETKLYK
ncbi:MAG: DUF4842 domain-containing protein [Bacteroidaceae bacterium]|nr:DUF4842 domain-containing protein [Bacteroidaceae bacterium]